MEPHDQPEHSQRPVEAVHDEIATGDPVGPREAKEQLAQGSFDLILLDIGLPDGEGTELLPFVGVTPVIIFSAAEGDLAASEKVAASLVKSRATEGDLRKAINSVLPAAS